MFRCCPHTGKCNNERKSQPYLAHISSSFRGFQQNWELLEMASQPLIYANPLPFWSSKRTYFQGNILHVLFWRKGSQTLFFLTHDLKKIMLLFLINLYHCYKILGFGVCSSTLWFWIYGWFLTLLYALNLHWTTVISWLKNCNLQRN